MRGNPIYNYRGPLWLQLVEHCYFAVETADDFVELGVTALHDECHVILGRLALGIGRLYVV